MYSSVFLCTFNACSCSCFQATGSVPRLSRPRAMLTCAARSSAQIHTSTRLSSPARTMDDNKVAFRHLARRVAGETVRTLRSSLLLVLIRCSQVTYRLLSRELGITVSAAKLCVPTAQCGPRKES